MPEVTEAHLEARRQQIINAAFACFSRNGFHQTTIQDICQEALLSLGAGRHEVWASGNGIHLTCFAGSQTCGRQEQRSER